MRAPIHSRKHYIQMSLSTVASVSLGGSNLIQAVAIQDVNVPAEIIEGAVIKAIYVELWTQGSANDVSEVVTLTKIPEAGSMTYTESIALDSYTNKKNVLFVHQGLSSNDGISNPLRVMANWYKIPKGKQRFGLGDKLTLTVSNFSPTETLNFCGFAVFKEYT